jgi:hypothetical protein
MSVPKMKIVIVIILVLIFQLWGYLLFITLAIMMV